MRPGVLQRTSATCLTRQGIWGLVQRAIWDAAKKIEPTGGDPVWDIAMRLMDAVLNDPDTKNPDVEVVWWNPEGHAGFRPLVQAHLPWLVVCMQISSTLNPKP